jgi:predicted nucleic acid-binding protein
MRAVDTNILIYAHDPRDPVKQTAATNLIESLIDGALLWQVACEYVAASRKLAAQGFDERQAWRDLNKLQNVWTTILPSWEVMLRAEQLLDKFHLSFWDALIVAACLEGGVTHLYTEDMGGNPNIAGLSIINPF